MYDYDSDSYSSNTSLRKFMVSVGVEVSLEAFKPILLCTSLKDLL